jgi:hypothetical protein
MRCEDVIRELATPTDARDAAFLSDHLSHCSSCAVWAERAARLDRLWQVTQPAEPTSDVWDSVWAHVVSSLHAQTANDIVSSAPATLRNGSAIGSMPQFEAKLRQRPFSRSLSLRRWATIGVIGLAQAAAVLLVVSMSSRFFRPSPPRSPENNVVASLASVDIEEGQVVMIVADSKLPAVVDLTPKATTDGVDHVDWYGDEKYFDWFLVYHEVESLAKPTVAMKE